MAIRAFQFIPGRPASRAHRQRVRTGPVRLPPYHDVLHGLDGYCDFHSRLLPVIEHPGMGRGNVRCLVGCLPGPPLL